MSGWGDRSAATRRSSSGRAAAAKAGASGTIKNRDKATTDELRLIRALRADPSESRVRRSGCARPEAAQDAAYRNVIIGK
jgi:hypothetical protein